jgi:N-acetylglucosamine kinase-like BadF-type ATPase
MEFYLGVDGGGTKTEFVCIDAGGTVVARAATGTTYHLQVGLAGAVGILQSGVAAICGQLAITPSSLHYTFFGLPAYGEDKSVDPKLYEACGQILRHANYACGNDMVCGWAGSLGCADGINLVAGTGSIGYGERQGSSARIGGWGEIFSDEGSAYWIAVQGLNAFTRMSDGRLAKSVLHDRFKESLGLAEDLDVCARIMGDTGMARDEVAGLAAIVSAAAREGDPAAADILECAARELADMAIALRQRLGFKPGERALLSWSGGVLTGEAGVLPVLSRLIDETGGFSLVAPLFTPGHGAALYARHRGRAKEGLLF